MKKNIIIGIVVVVVVVVAFVGYQALRLRSEAAKWSGPMQEIAEEKMEHDGNVSHTRFVSVIDAPVAAVLKALWDVENSQNTIENIKLSKLLDSKGNTKLVEMNLLALNLPLQAYTMEFMLHPEEHRITFKTVKSQAQDINGEYALEASPDGKKTRLTYNSTSKAKVAVPFPQSVLDGAERETYVNTVRGIQKSVKQG
jgi:hypothetical protein